MKRYVLKRILAGLVTILIVFTINFILIKAAPGDPITTLMGKDNTDPELRAALEEKYGLNKPLISQYLSNLTAAVQGDLGTSIIYNRPVSAMIAEKLIPTAILVLTAAILALFIGTILGIYAARYRNSVFDHSVSVVSYILNSMPSFWLGLMLIILFTTKFKWLPSYGMTDSRNFYEGFAYVVDVLKHMILPVTTLTLVQIPSYFRIAKSSVVQISNEDFIMTFKAAGMDESKVFRKYIFRNAILPTITIFGITLAYLVTGVALIEIVFAWPGMGRLVMTAINQRDYPTLMGIYLVMSACIAVVMVVIDIVYALFDPRIRYE